MLYPQPGLATLRLIVAKKPSWVRTPSSNNIQGDVIGNTSNPRIGSATSFADAVGAAEGWLAIILTYCVYLIYAYRFQG